jgi:hypothetical protein
LPQVLGQYASHGYDYMQCCSFHTLQRSLLASLLPRGFDEVLCRLGFPRSFSLLFCEVFPCGVFLLFRLYFLFLWLVFLWWRRVQYLRLEVQTATLFADCHCHCQRGGLAVAVAVNWLNGAQRGVKEGYPSWRKEIEGGLHFFPVIHPNLKDFIHKLSNLSNKVIVSYVLAVFGGCYQ